MPSAKRAKRARSAGEFDLVRLAAELRSPPQSGSVFAWDLESIRCARAAQMRGTMRSAAELGMAIKTDGAIYSALGNRLAPQKSLPVGLRPANETAMARILCAEAEPLFGPKGIAFSRGARLDINEALAVHGFAVATNTLTPQCDGRRVDFEVKPWPMEFVSFNRSKRCLETTANSGCTEEIVHGNGRWLVFSHGMLQPWGWGALLPLALIWADRAYGIRDRSKTGTSHGNAKMIGELPAGIAINSEEGAAFLLLLKTMHDALPYGIRPAGSKTDMLVNSSTAWQIFKEIIDSNLSDAARVLNGHDGTIRASGGNYIKDGYLFGVSADIVEGDVHSIEGAFQTGTIEPWAALNFGSSEHAPIWEYKLPDPDADIRAKSLTERRSAFWDDVERARKNGVLVDQKYLDDRAKELGIVTPTLVTAPAGAVTAQEPVDEAVAELAAKMTELGILKCEHGHSNRCWLCGIERKRDVSVDENGGEVWAVAWKPIGPTASSPSPAPASAPTEVPEDQAPPDAPQDPEQSSARRLRVAR